MLTGNPRRHFALFKVVRAKGCLALPTSRPLGTLSRLGERVQSRQVNERNRPIRDLPDIPIYRCTRDRHAGEMDVAKGRFASAFRGTDAFADRKRKELRDFFDRAKWYPWRYNEIVGYIRLVTRRSELVGELFLREAKRLTGRPTARFLYKGKTLFTYVRPEWTNAQIRQRICAELIGLLRSDQRLRRRTLDTEVLLSIGPFVDWRGLVDAASRNSGSA